MLERIIRDLHKPDAVSAYLRVLGAQHFDFQVLHVRPPMRIILVQESGFRLSFWDVFAEAMTECAIEWEGGTRYLLHE